MGTDRCSPDGLGFVVARFGFFLHAMAAVRHVAAPPERAVSLWFGTALVLLGVVVNVAAACMHTRTIRRLDQGLPVRFRAVSLGTVAAMFLGALGLALTAYLLFGLDDPTLGTRS